MSSFVRGSVERFGIVEKKESSKEEKTRIETGMNANERKRRKEVISFMVFNEECV